MSLFDDFRRGLRAARAADAAQADYAAAKGRRDDIRPDIEVEAARPAERSAAEIEARLRELLQQDAASRALREAYAAGKALGLSPDAGARLRAFFRARGCNLD